MERYLQQLKEDLREAAAKAEVKEKMLNESMAGLSGFEKHIADVERYLHGPLEKLSEIIEIEKYQLPPVEKLTKKQVSNVYMEFTNLLSAYHFYPEFPKGVPVTLKYKLLREKLDEKFTYMGSGQTHIEFCSYLPEACPLPEKFCSCKEWADD